MSGVRAASLDRGTDGGPAVRFAILGSVAFAVRGEPVALGGRGQVALLAFLLIHAGEAIPRERIVDALWPGSEPGAVTKRLQVAIARLRRTLAAEDRLRGSRLETVTMGYRLRIDEDELDAIAFAAGVAAGRQALHAGDPRRAACTLREALALWRGPALADVAYADFAQSEIARLDELRLTALEGRLEADLQLGRHADVVAELEALVAEHPDRESLTAHLMLALYRSGRQGAALDAYRRTREHLVRELGLEPGPELARLQSKILAHDEELLAAGGADSDPTTPPSVPPVDTLPRATNRLVGRDEDVGRVVARLTRDDVHLLTLVGPGGVGKTRLALAAAQAVAGDFADGARMVPLASVSRPEEVPGAIVQALGIVATPGEPPDRAVARYVAPKHMLLVLDNLEHVLAMAPFVAELLARSPALTVLATSREPLAITGEERYVVAPLGLPPDGDDPARVADAPAVALFTERARAHDAAFSLAESNARAIVEICRGVDGLPLGLELAAARCTVLSPAEIAERLHASLGALAGGPRDAPARQRTLRATVEWSHDLLSDAEQQTFCRFAVFEGGATIEDAEAVTGADLDTLGALVDKSLLGRAEQAGRTRLTMLETIRAYAVDRLAARDDHESVRRRHMREYLTRAEAHGAEQAICGPDRAEHLARLDDDIANLHAALRFALDVADAEAALRLVAALGHYWLMRGRTREAVAWMDEALALRAPPRFDSVRVRVLCMKSWALRWDDPGGQVAAITAAEVLARRVGDPIVLAQALQTHAKQRAIDNDLEACDALADEALALAERAGDRWEIANAHDARAMGAADADELHKRVARAVETLAEVGNLYQLVSLLPSAAYAALCMRADRDAKHYADEALRLVGGSDDERLQMIVDGNRGLALLFCGELDEAERALRDELAASRRLVMPIFALEGLLGLAGVAAARRHDERAATLAGAATNSSGEIQPDMEERAESEFFAEARARIGIDAWDAASARGAAMTIDEAIAYALAAAAARR